MSGNAFPPTPDPRFTGKLYLPLFGLTGNLSATFLANKDFSGETATLTVLSPTYPTGRNGPDQLILGVGMSSYVGSDGNLNSCRYNFERPTVELNGQVDCKQVPGTGDYQCSLHSKGNEWVNAACAQQLIPVYLRMVA